MVRLMACAMAVTLIGVGCARTQDCSAVALMALDVVVQDGSGGEVCDAVVTATDGDFTQQLQVDLVSPCHYRGVTERAGTYTVTATRSGRSASASDVMVEKDECHVITKQVTITL
jgi:nitrous oxide reductase accessory protein NosL